jgi:hypothetical protein
MDDSNTFPGKLKEKIPDFLFSTLDDGSMICFGIFYLWVSHGSEIVFFVLSHCLDKSLISPKVYITCQQTTLVLYCLCVH